MTNPNVAPVRGEIWEVRFDPTEGGEIRKTGPAVMMNVRSAGVWRSTLWCRQIGVCSAHISFITTTLITSPIWVESEYLKRYKSSLETES